MTSYLSNGHDVIDCFAKFEQFLPHCIIMSSCINVRRQIPELDLEGGGIKVKQEPWLYRRKLSVKDQRYRQNVHDVEMNCACY